MSNFLEKLNTPDDVRKLSRSELEQAASELRSFIIHSVSRTGGHLSSNLGTVELTLALHYVFNTPHDRIIWDVGHQSYPHKILTGRREGMAHLRQEGGISGFPKRSESEYDAFGTAHSSTSISAALGMAVASRNLQIERQHIAVIGDGSMTAGMAYEALNNAGVTPGINLLVILNDNDMSISPPVGALNKYLARLLSGTLYQEARSVGKAVLGQFPSPVMEMARKMKGHAKGILGAATWFEEFGFNYVGPIDGHDLDALVPTLQNLRQMGGLQFLHVVTKKGQGYKMAEADPILYHGPGKFDPEVGIQKPAKPGKQTFTQVFGHWLCDMASQDEKLVGITPAMREGSGMVEFEKRFPNRYFDVGIAEQHSVTFAAGIACEGLKPVLAIYSTFLQRGYDQLIHDVALQNLDVTFALDRAGLVGADGATHAGNYDIAFLRCIPNMVVAVPSDENEARLLLNTCYHYQGPASVRYPRGAGAGANVSDTLDPVELGKGVVRREGSRLAILAFGPLLHAALPVAEKLNATLVDMRFVKPIDAELVKQLAASHEVFVTLEEGSVMGGAGSAVAELMSAFGLSKPILQLGLPDRFIDHGDQAALLKGVGLDSDGIEASIHARFKSVLNIT
ncbi:1-deoxy-D-xylulose-5-phosphate synthase [Advenella alkanexedens]|uniref:1-deoxy-D-xylulose-5-phosphate synthase n=1 Tax=Advenella alkanexedens TaxID=1481665 RepID=A0ABS6NMM5_9BURK|nr:MULTISPECIES: 1-deoxy-D-xylulose-5-phosphate synthase [Advenella]MBV4396884.1 1-deoxy-D-xylulose-5-phosphate synthase [Advenella alkanexedens]MDD3756579.1 1-deoxy-D-xylulose-5-phosphate synthase [Advenella sp.]